MKKSLGLLVTVSALALTVEAETLEFAAEVYNANEGAGTVTLTVIKSGTATGTVTVKYSTGDFPPGTSLARAGQDYSTRPGRSLSVRRRP
jgi:hypothetical protein